jgi:hypothetical protein
MRSAKRRVVFPPLAWRRGTQARSLICCSRFSTTRLSPRHQERSLVCRSDLYHLRSFTRATRFACASRPSTNDPSRIPARYRLR